MYIVYCICCVTCMQACRPTTSNTRTVAQTCFFVRLFFFFLHKLTPQRDVKNFLCTFLIVFTYSMSCVAVVAHLLRRPSKRQTPHTNNANNKYIIIISRVAHRRIGHDDNNDGGDGGGGGIDVRCGFQFCTLQIHTYFSSAQRNDIINHRIVILHEETRNI